MELININKKIIHEKRLVNISNTVNIYIQSLFTEKKLIKKILIKISNKF